MTTWYKILIGKNGDEKNGIIIDKFVCVRLCSRPDECDGQGGVIRRLGTVGGRNGEGEGNEDGCHYRYRRTLQHPGTGGEHTRLLVCGIRRSGAQRERTAH